MTNSFNNKIIKFKVKLKFQKNKQRKNKKLFNPKEDLPQLLFLINNKNNK